MRISREFDAPPELVYRAHVDPELVKQWIGPRSIDMDIKKWDMRTGGEYRYTALRDGEEVAHFYGSIHRVWENEKIVQTFGFEEMPEAVALETLELVDLGNGRTRLEILSVVESMEAQAGMMASGMEVGVTEGYAALDEVLAGTGDGSRRVIPTDPAEEHRAIAGLFADRVRGVATDGWDAQSPVADWRARDVVRHLVEWFPGFLAGGSDIKLDARAIGGRRPGRRVGPPRRGRARGPRRPGERDRRPSPIRTCPRCRSPRRSRVLHQRHLHAHLGPRPRDRSGRPPRRGALPGSCTRGCSRWTRCCARAAVRRPRPRAGRRRLANQDARLHRARPGVQGWVSRQQGRLSV